MSTSKRSFIENIFSVRNEGTRKVVCILGLKIRFRTLKLVLRELNKRLEKQCQINSELNNRLEKQSQINNELNIRLEKQCQINNELNIRLEKQSQISSELNSRLENQTQSLGKSIRTRYRLLNSLLEKQGQISNELNIRLEKQSQISNELNSRLEKQGQINNELNISLEKQTENLSRSIRSKYRLLMYKIHRYCPDEKRAIALQDWFYEQTGDILNLDNPQTYNEKIQWLKLHDSTPIKTQLADKYLVREWIKEKIGDDYLIPLLGVWDNFEDIDFSQLPNKFVLKCNHGSGYNIIVKDKSKLDMEEAKKQIKSWMSEDYSFKHGFELHYTQIQRKIIAEKYIENSEGDLYDYKFWCFDGVVKYIEFILGRHTAAGAEEAFYNKAWKKQDFSLTYAISSKIINRPDNLDLMIKLAEKLSKGFSHVRVDFYDVNNKIYFGEMTFTTSSGTGLWLPKKTDLEFGTMLKLPAQNHN